MSSRPPLDVRRRVGAGLVVIGLVLAGYGLYLPAKAALSQVLLHVAFVRAQHGDELAKPWPWADMRPVARLVDVERDEAVYVLSDASGRSLAFGPGVVADSAPLGSDGHVVLAGHRDTHFSFLGDLQSGDPLRLELPDGRARAYVIDRARVVHERDGTVGLDDGTPSLSLVTCWPLDAVVPGTDQRYVVEAKSAPPGGEAVASRAW